MGTCHVEKAGNFGGSELLEESEESREHGEGGEDDRGSQLAGRVKLVKYACDIVLGNFAADNLAAVGRDAVGDFGRLGYFEHEAGFDGVDGIVRHLLGQLLEVNPVLTQALYVRNRWQVVSQAVFHLARLLELVPRAAVGGDQVQGGCGRREGRHLETRVRVSVKAG